MDALTNKIIEAQHRVREAVNRVGGINKICIAYSGGKDSEAVLRLVRGLYPTAIVVHNGHRGEHVGDVPGILFVKEPKKQNVPQFLAAIELIARKDVGNLAGKLVAPNAFVIPTATAATVLKFTVRR